MGKIKIEEGDRDRDNACLFCLVDGQLAKSWQTIRSLQTFAINIPTCRNQSYPYSDNVVRNKGYATYNYQIVIDQLLIADTMHTIGSMHLKYLSSFILSANFAHFSDLHESDLKISI